MPNMVGGDQMHPAYTPRKLKRNEVLIGNNLYTINMKNPKKVAITCETIDGQSWMEVEKNTPKKVQNRIALLRRKP